MQFETLIKKIIENLGADYKGYILNVKHSTNEEELFSFLREKLFKSDLKTRNFINAAKAEFTPKKILTNRQMSEAQFTEFIFNSVKANLGSKGSPLKYVSHYFSIEKDLAITVADESGFQSGFRVLSIKTT